MSDAVAARPPSDQLATVLDVAERIVVAVLLMLLCERLLNDYRASGRWINLLLLAGESLIVFFILIRRRTNFISVRPGDWFFAATGTAGPLLVAAGGHPLLAQPACGMILFCGLLLQLSAKFALRRSFGLVAANRGIKATGPYRLLRHPMYAGYLLSHIGFLLANPALWNLIVYVLADGSQILRMNAEERMLGEDPGYRTLCRNVRWRIIPFVY